MCNRSIHCYSTNAHKLYRRYPDCKIANTSYSLCLHICVVLYCFAVVVVPVVVVENDYCWIPMLYNRPVYSDFVQYYFCCCCCDLMVVLIDFLVANNRWAVEIQQSFVNAFGEAGILVCLSRPIISWRNTSCINSLKNETNNFLWYTLSIVMLFLQRCKVNSLHSILPIDFIRGLN
uniref:Uncharacterized protein n=1 Tax=Glossina brevipalpis TaxID=37001 RepID=A0A1A9X2J9_9MUSC